MVAAAKIEREAVEKKNEQLRSQVKDTELLLASHQDQLAELKSVMQAMNLQKDDIESRATATPSSSPDELSQAQGSSTQETDIEPVPILIDSSEEFTPGPSSNFPQLLRMVCRTDLQAYEDFRDLLILSIVDLITHQRVYPFPQWEHVFHNGIEFFLEGNPLLQAGAHGGY